MKNWLGGLGVGAMLLAGCQGPNSGGTWRGSTLEESGAPDDNGVIRMVLREKVPGVVEGELFYEGDPELIPAGPLHGTRAGDTVELEGVGWKLMAGKLTATKLAGTLEYQGIPTEPEPLKARVELLR